MALAETLAKIKKGPAAIEGAGEGGAVLALALHCLMVNHGYQPSPFNRQNPAAPAKDWSSRYQDEWVFEYTRKGYESVFVLHCSLQAASGKMFVQGREKDNSMHMHNLGLQVEKYISAPERCKSSTWEGVLESEDVLDDMFREYIADPLRKQAAPCGKAVTGYEATLDWLKQKRDMLDQRDVFVPLGIAITAASIAAVAVYFYRQKRSGQ